MPLTVHHLSVSQSDRIIWLCEELGVPYDLKRYERSPLLAPPEYKALHPVGSAPVVEDADKGLKLAESAACAEYIAQVYGDGRFVVKPGEEGYADYLYWFHFANGTMTPAMMRILILNQVAASQSQSSSSSDQPNPLFTAFQIKFNSILSYLDSHLSSLSSSSSGRYLAGGTDITLADIMLVCDLTTMRSFIALDLSEYEAILAYLRRVAARPAYRAAVAKGDPDFDVDALVSAAGPARFVPKQQQK